MEWSFHLSDIDSVANEFVKNLKNNQVLAFEGEMGAGKTTFIHAICRALNVSSSVGSPTFSIINQYSWPGGILYHMDLYRLKDEEEAIRAGVEDCLYSNHLCMVEWPARAPGIFPPETLRVSIKMLDTERRHILIEGEGFSPL